MHVIILGNEKGGSGKTTTSMHLTTSLLAMGQTVAAMDLDVRQRSFTRYLENRLAYAARHEMSLTQPRYIRFQPSELSDKALAAEEDTIRIKDCLSRAEDCDFLVIDCPGSDSTASRVAHDHADTIITPINDSFVDLDLIGHVDPDSFEVLTPSYYAEMVFKARQRRAGRDKKQIDWVILRNRLSQLQAHNQQRVGDALINLSKRVGFRVVPGMSERVIFRELFPKGLTLMDLGQEEKQAKMTMSHIAARQEVRALIAALQLPLHEQNS
ncbi:MAG: ATPase [Alphaproteobacteria bacterium]|nr:ATPase [Alphaproteobacteria bacterium]